MIEDLPIAIHLKTLNNWDQRFGVIYQPERKYNYSKLGEFLPLLMNLICRIEFLPFLITVEFILNNPIPSTLFEITPPPF